MSELLDVTDQDSTLRVKLTLARLEAAQAQTLKDAFEKLWNTEIQSVEIDFSEVEFIDSSGIGALLSIHKKLSPSQGNIVLTHVKSQVQTVIELLRLHRIFEIHS